MGSRSLVNPGVRDVQAAVRAEAPHLLDGGPVGTGQPSATSGRGALLTTFGLGAGWVVLAAAARRWRRRS